MPVAFHFHTMADGRELIDVDDADTTLSSERRADERTLEPRPETATMRRDILTGSRFRGKRQTPWFPKHGITPARFRITMTSWCSKIALPRLVLP